MIISPDSAPTQPEGAPEPLAGPLSSLSSIDTSGVNRLRDELVDVQRRLQNALRLRQQSGHLPDKNAGHVDVDFVRTKPSKRGRLRCKKKQNVKTILHQFHADFPEGCVTALMGPSGAGKTTLLDFLTGMLGDSVHASGQVALPDDDAYVPQDDRLHSFYTCQAYMKHYARLMEMTPLFDCCRKTKDVVEDGDEERATANGAQDDVDKLILDILSEVGLAAQKDTVVGGLFQRGLSGGQKRRLSVALEALSSPLNLFLDEPTSGLDSESALALMQYLHRYARGRDPKTGRRRRVIVTIHQPSSQIWEAIDNVVLLAAGRLMYQGPRQEMEIFFGAYGHPVPVNYNPADHFIEVLFKMPSFDAVELGGVPQDANSSELWSSFFKKWSQDQRQLDTDQENALMRMGKSKVIRRDPASSSRLVKMKAVTKKNNTSAIELTRRSFASLLKNPVALGLRMAIYGGMSLMIGILFFGLESQDSFHSIMLARTALLYFIIAFCSSMSVAVIPFAMVDRAILYKEVRNHMFHPAFYHAAQALAGIPVCFILSLVVSVIVLGMTGIVVGDRLGFWFVLFLTFLCADATSMFIAHISPELISAICISSGVFGLFTMIMGFLVTPSQLGGLVFLYYIPFMTYSFRALMYMEYSEMIFFDNSTFDPENMPYPPDDQLGGWGSIIYNNTGISAIGTEILRGLEGQVYDGMDIGNSLNGTEILKSYEMENVNVRHDEGILLLWACVMNTVSIIYLFWNNHKSRRIFVYSDGE